MCKTVWGMRLFAVLVAIFLGSFAGTSAQAAGAAHRYIVIAHQQGSGSAALDEAVRAAGGVVTVRVDAIGALAAESDSSDFAARLAADSRVQHVVEDVEVQWLPDGHAVPASEGDLQELGVNTEPSNGRLWNIRAIGANLTAAANIQGNTVKRARVAVLDSGVWDNHPDLIGNVTAGLGKSYVLTAGMADFDGDGVPETEVPPEPTTRPIVLGFSHGTHVSGIVAAAINGIGVQGVAPKAEIVPFKVLRSTTGGGSFLWVAQGIVDAANIDADVINMSLGATFARPLVGGYGPYVALFTRAINYATRRGTLVVTAAGNEGLNLDSIFWSVPAQLGNGMAVSATGPKGIAQFGEANVNLDRFASYSNYGVSVVNVAAPGGDFATYPAAGYYLDMVLSPGGLDLCPGSTSAYCWYSYYAAGTSMAAPHVSGLAALIVGEYGRIKPSQLKAMIERSAADLYKPGTDPFSGRGRIDAARAFGLR